MTSTSAGMWVIAGLFILAALFLFASVGLMWWDDVRARRRARFSGGYPSGDRPASTYRKPPAGPAPGSSR